MTNLILILFAGSGLALLVVSMAALRTILAHRGQWKAKANSLAYNLNMRYAMGELSHQEFVSEQTRMLDTHRA